MMHPCWIGPGTLRRCYDPRGVDAGGPIVARLRLSGESEHPMSDLSILDPDWWPSTDVEALEAGELLKAAYDRLLEWHEEREPWRAFLKDHPELKGYMAPAGETIYGDSYSEHFHFRGLPGPPYEAIIAALEKLAPTKPEGVTAREIAQALWGADARKEDVPDISWRIQNMIAHRKGAPHAARRVSRARYLPLESGDDA